MAHNRETRRDFIKVASAAVVSGSITSTARPHTPAAAKVPNYNPNVNYRRLGKTEFMISEIALGGHGAHGYDERAVQNRIPVLERAVELGMNYVDTNIGRECDVYGEAMARSAGAKRDKWFIGFASSEDHYVPGLENQLNAAKLMSSIEDRLRSYKTDMLDDRLVPVPTHVAESVRLMDATEEVARHKPVVPTKWYVSALDRATGKAIWNQPLASEPVYDGICIARDGSVLVQRLGGSVVCVAKPDTP